MSEWNEDKLDRELNAMAEEIPEPEKLEAKIIRSINRRIRRTVLGCLLVVACVILGAVLVVEPLISGMYLNPYQLNQEPERTMLYVLRDYYETVHPYRELASLEVEEKGFARYELRMQILDLTEPIRIETPNICVEMVRGVYRDYFSEDVPLHNMSRFTAQWNDQEEMTRKISELPQSALVYLSVSDTAPRDLETLRNLPVSVKWIQVYQPDVDFNGGINLEMVTLYEEDEDRREKTPEELLAIYCGNLENLVDHSDIWSQLSLCDGRGTIYYEQSLTETWENAKTLTSLESKNYCVYGQRDEVVQFLQENSLDSLYVENVRLW